MNYKIILDESILKNFINWLPELLVDEYYYLSLFARKKYCRDIKLIKTDKCQMKRFTSKKDMLFGKIKQLETPIGSYVQNGGIVVPQESLALYISINPRSMMKAARLGLVELSKLIANGQLGFNTHQVILSCIQKSISKKLFVDFDFDDPSFDYNRIYDCVNKDAATILKTRGGYHVLVETKKIENNKYPMWYKNISNLGADVKGDNLIPVPGCYQGGFTPSILT